MYEYKQILYKKLQFGDEQKFIRHLHLAPDP